MLPYVAIGQAIDFADRSSYHCAMLKKDVIEHFGSQASVAAALGISQPSVADWGETVPPLRQIQLERITGGKLKASPDIFGPPKQSKVDGNGDGRNDGHGRDGDGDGDGRFELPSSNDPRRTTLHRVDSTIVESVITDDGEEVERELSHVAVAGIGQIAAMPSQAVKAVIPLTLAATRGSAMAKVRKAREV